MYAVDFPPFSWNSKNENPDSLKSYAFISSTVSGHMLKAIAEKEVFLIVGSTDGIGNEIWRVFDRIQMDR